MEDTMSKKDKPTKPAPYYLVVTDGNVDGSFEPENHSSNTFTTEAEAIAAAKSDIEAYGLRSWIIECKPIAKVVLTEKVMRLK